MNVPQATTPPKYYGPRATNVHHYNGPPSSNPAPYYVPRASTPPKYYDPRATSQLRYNSRPVSFPAQYYAPRTSNSFRYNSPPATNLPQYNGPPATTPAQYYYPRASNPARYNAPPATNPPQYNAPPATTPAPYYYPRASTPARYNGPPATNIPQYNGALAITPVQHYYPWASTPSKLNGLRVSQYNGAIANTPPHYYSPTATSQFQNYRTSDTYPSQYNGPIASSSSQNHGSQRSINWGSKEAALAERFAHLRSATSNDTNALIETKKRTKFLRSAIRFGSALVGLFGRLSTYDGSMATNPPNYSASTILPNSPPNEPSEQPESIDSTPSKLNGHRVSLASSSPQYHGSMVTKPPNYSASTLLPNIPPTESSQQPESIDIKTHRNRHLINTEVCGMSCKQQNTCRKGERVSFYFIESLQSLITFLISSYLELDLK